MYHVGRPAILEGDRFLPLTGIPIRKIDFNRTELADCDPDPFTVAIWMLKSLTIAPCGDCWCVSGLLSVPPSAPAASATFSVAMS